MLTGAAWVNHQFASASCEDEVFHPSLGQRRDF
jgi:hypothetical protein